MVKQLSTARNTQRDSQVYREESREEEDRDDQEEKKESQKGRESHGYRASNHVSSLFEKTLMDFSL